MLSSRNQIFDKYSQLVIGTHTKWEHFVTEIQQYLRHSDWEQNFCEEICSLFVALEHSDLKHLTPMAKAFQCLEKYALNLVKYPWKAEIRMLKTYCGYYQMNVAWVMPGAECILQKMGYRRRGQVNNMERQTFVIEEDDILMKKLLTIACECFIAAEECLVMQKLCEEHNCKVFTDVLKARQDLLHRNTRGSPSMQINEIELARDFQCAAKWLNDGKDPEPMDVNYCDPDIITSSSQGKLFVKMPEPMYQTIDADVVVQPCDKRRLYQHQGSHSIDEISQHKLVMSSTRIPSSQSSTEKLFKTLEHNAKVDDSLRRDSLERFSIINNASHTNHADIGQCDGFATFGNKASPFKELNMSSRINKGDSYNELASPTKDKVPGSETINRSESLDGLQKPWSCHKCTYSNKANTGYCEICEASRLGDR